MFLFSPKYVHPIRYNYHQTDLTTGRIVKKILRWFEWNVKSVTTPAGTCAAVLNAAIFGASPVRRMAKVIIRNNGRRMFVRIAMLITRAKQPNNCAFSILKWKRHHFPKCSKRWNPQERITRSRAKPVVCCLYALYERTSHNELGNTFAISGWTI